MFRGWIQGLNRTFVSRFSQAAQPPASMRNGNMYLAPISAKPSVTKIGHVLDTNYGAMKPGWRPCLRMSSRISQEDSLAQRPAFSNPTPPGLLAPIAERWVLECQLGSKTGGP